MKNFRLSLQVKFLLSIIIIVVPLMGIIFAWAGARTESQAMAQVVNQARVLSRQIILTRQWVADCGGVMVAEGSKGAADTVFFYEDRLETSRGTYLKFTPSMVTKKLSDYSFKQDLYRFRLSSLWPLNPENLPDVFEKEALNSFIKEGTTEMIRLKTTEGGQELQYVVPVLWRSSCMDCHKKQEENPNLVGGGLSVFLPVAEMKRSLAKDQKKLAVSGVGLIFMTILTLFVFLRRAVIRPLRALEEMTNEISRGNLDVRADIHTGDEFEKLGKAFNNMTRQINRGRDLLEEKIAQATLEVTEANRELQTLDKLKSDFLANMSHELRSPLTVLRGGIDYLNRTIRKEDNRHYLEIIDKNLNRLIRLVTDLFDFTKIEAKTVAWSFSEENLTVLIQEVKEITSPLAMEKNVVVVFESTQDIYAKFDLERIEQVLVNLVDNAIKFSDPETEIRIAAEQDRDKVTVSVQDQGVGIPKENIKSIFSKFSTVPSSEKDGKMEGTGLGLAICKAIIQAHGGKIWAESVKDQPITFRFTLPKMME